MKVKTSHPGYIRTCIHHEKILLLKVINMAYTREEETSDRVLVTKITSAQIKNSQSAYGPHLQ